MSAGGLTILVLTFLMCHIYVYSVLVVSSMKCRNVCLKKSYTATVMFLVKMLPDFSCNTART